VVADRQSIERVLAAFDQGDWDEIHLVTGDVELHLVATADGTEFANLLDKSASALPPSGGAASTPTAAAAATPATGPAATGTPTDAAASTVPNAPATGPVTDAGPLTEVVAPSPGIFWRSPRPGAPPFAEVGDRVEPGTTMCIVEVMKLMNHVTAQVPGTVVEVLAGNGEQVDRGQPLFRIRPEGA
jgi:biotin carboxyl carrier protein